MQSSSPFLKKEFFQALEGSGVIGHQSGWIPLYFEDSSNILFSFIKSHSYGEYIFDWDWANFYHSNGIEYYPKLTSMIPFTSATSSHFLAGPGKELFKKYEQFFLSNDFSSSHFLFITKEEISFFKSFNYIIRESFQYHFLNTYESFDDFLSSLKSRKAKQIRKERLFSEQMNFVQFSGPQLTDEHAKRMYQYYISTIDNKNSYDYLNEAFFLQTFKTTQSSILFVEAYEDSFPVGGALYFFNSECLYGRYWGCTSEIKNLHFELCYYQGIDFCIKNSITRFEAGAQGEHKISRGFRPTKTYSAHKMKDPQIHKAIQSYVEQEKKSIDGIFPALNAKLPFKD